jgi:hypothetical protein
LAIQIEQLLVFEVTQQRLMVCLIVRVLKGPTFACLPFGGLPEEVPLVCPLSKISTNQNNQIDLGAFARY